MLLIQYLSNSTNNAFKPQEVVNLAGLCSEASEMTNLRPRRKKNLSKKKIKLNLPKKRKKRGKVLHAEENGYEYEDETERKAVSEGGKRKRRAGADEEWITTHQKKDKLVKKKNKQEDEEKGDEAGEQEEQESWEAAQEAEEKEETEKGEDDRSVHFEPTEGNFQTWKDCQVSIQNVCNHHE